MAAARQFHRHGQTAPRFLQQLRQRHAMSCHPRTWPPPPNTGSVAAGLTAGAVHASARPHPCSACVQEPAERTLSAWHMVNRTHCAAAKPSDGCRVPPFQEVVAGDLDPKGRPDCIFGTAVRPRLPPTPTLLRHTPTAGFTAMSRWSHSRSTPLRCGRYGTGQSRA